MGEFHGSRADGGHAQRSHGIRASDRPEQSVGGAVVERSSIYGMLAMLGYYLYYSATEGGLDLPQSTATGIVGAYGGLVYRNLGAHGR